MKTLILAALGASLVAQAAVGPASAAQRDVRASARTQVQTTNPAVRESFNAYGRGFDTPAYDTRVYGGAIAAPAGR